jgi:hypothetical protein
LPLDQHFQKKLLHLFHVNHYLLVTRLGVGSRRRQFQPIQRALARQRLTTILLPQPVLSSRIFFPHQHRQQRVLAQPVMIVEILVSQRQPIHPLPHQLFDRVLDYLCFPVIHKTLRKLPNDVSLRFQFPQQQRSPIGCDRAPVESRHHCSIRQPLKLIGLLITLCSHQAAAPFASKLIFPNCLDAWMQPDSFPLVRNPG